MAWGFSTHTLQARAGTVRVNGILLCQKLEIYGISKNLLNPLYQRTVIVVQRSSMDSCRELKHPDFDCLKLLLCEVNSFNLSCYRISAGRKFQTNLSIKLLNLCQNFLKGSLFIHWGAINALFAKSNSCIQDVMSLKGQQKVIKKSGLFLIADNERAVFSMKVSLSHHFIPL